MLLNFIFLYFNKNWILDFKRNLLILISKIISKYYSFFIHEKTFNNYCLNEKKYNYLAIF